jgi:hypothetical protein
MIMFVNTLVLSCQMHLLHVPHLKRFFFFKSVYWGVDSSWVHLSLRPPRGLLCQPWVIMMKEKLVEWLAGETEVLGEDLAPVPLCAPQTPASAQTQTWAAAVGSQRLTAWATTQQNGLATVHFWAILVNVPSYLISNFTALRIKDLALQLSCFVLFKRHVYFNFHSCIQTIKTISHRSIYYSQNVIY